jgi:hypothetical protein
VVLLSLLTTKANSLEKQPVRRTTHGAGQQARASSPGPRVPSVPTGPGHVGHVHMFNGEGRAGPEMESLFVRIGYPWRLF